MVFAAAALGFITLFAQTLILASVKDRWEPILLAVWGVLELLAFRGRWLCRRAKASLRTKNLLRASLVLTGLAALLEIGLAVFTGLVYFKIIELDEQALQLIEEHLWLALLAPLVHLLSTILFLFYIRGLAIAIERSEYGTDAVAVVVAGGLIYLVLLPVILLLIWLFYYLKWIRWDVIRLLLQPHVIAGGFWLLALYPIILYYRLLTQLRNALLYMAETEEREKKHKRHGG